MLLRLIPFLLSSVIISCTQDSSSEENQNSDSELEKKELKYDPSCEWCGANEAPPNLSWKTTIAEENEPGERIKISGTVYQKDGKTPASDVIVYVYHTNNEGKYPKKGDETGNGKRHGYLRGWMKTNEEGQYQFESIKPAAYKSHGGEPAHVHYVIKPPGESEYWINALVFEDDPRVTKDVLKNANRDGGFGIVTGLERNEKGILIGQRSIILNDY